ncbi:hypothetical protein RV14_GL000447 [Enterococcus ratti]|uniref:Uncharacterized protein n=1 Tax=Enterococcus ratti TaxID=150033 RepID=A0A1L8WI47_9ENTE|nr:hypothetical protein RV14_GL000447 [Enterococcus ratti]
MELLEKETFYYRYKNDLIEPVYCAFLRKKNIKGIQVITKLFSPF